VYAAAESREQDAEFSLKWLKAYGVGAVGVAGRNSPEFWKQFKHPDKFEGTLTALWRENDTTIYRVPLRTTSLAHVVPQSARVDRSPAGPGDLARLTRLVESLDNPALANADFHWTGRNSIHIDAVTEPGDVVFIQVTHHPGWRATVAGSKVELHRDGLGLMWLQPGCNGACKIDLEYTGGLELRLCWFVRCLALALLLVGGPVLQRRKRGLASSRE
jgi:hypothetical protein